MKGAWKPLAVWAGLAAVFALLLAVGAAGKGFPLTTWAVVSASFLPFVALLYVTGTIPVKRFVAGVREAGTHWQVLDDRMTWFGSRTLTAQTAAGVWIVKGQAGLRSFSLMVRFPETDAFQAVAGDARKAGRAAVAGPPTEDEAGRPLPAAVRRILALLVVASAMAGLGVGSWGIGRAATRVGHDVSWAFFWYGLGMAWFITVVGVAIVAWRLAERRAPELGRRGAAAALVVGAGGGVLAVEGLWLATAPWRGDASAVAAWAVLAAGLAVAIGFSVTLRAGPWVRPALVAAVAAVAFAAFWAPAIFFTSCTLAVCLVALFQALTRAPPTTASAP